MTELTKDGKPRKRRSGGGRPPNLGEETRSIRVPVSVPTELCTAIPELQAVLDHWDSECSKNPDAVRYYFLKQALDEIRALGF